MILILDFFEPHCRRKLQANHPGHDQQSKAHELKPSLELAYVRIAPSDVREPLFAHRFVAT
jgi:hypothetical protein